MTASILGLTGLAAVVIILVILAILVFEIWMFVDAIQNKAISSKVKLLWLLGMILLHPFIAIIYYFTDHRKARL